MSSIDCGMNAFVAKTRNQPKYLTITKLANISCYRQNCVPPKLIGQRPKPNMIIPRSGL